MGTGISVYKAPILGLDIDGKVNIFQFARAYLLGGWTNPFEKYARQIGSFPQI